MCRFNVVSWLCFQARNSHLDSHDYSICVEMIDSSLASSVSIPFLNESITIIFIITMSKCTLFAYVWLSSNASCGFSCKTFTYKWNFSKNILSYYKKQFYISLLVKKKDRGQHGVIRELQMKPLPFKVNKPLLTLPII